MRLIIPTRNRPTSLGGVLRYYETFYPDASLIIADGSTSDFQKRNETICTETPLTIQYQAFDPEIGLFDRLLMVLRNESDPYFLMAADDDYPILETLQKARIRLDKRPEIVCSGGFLLHLNVISDTTANVTLDPPRNIVSPSASRRMNQFSRFPFATSYMLARRELLIARYEFMSGWHVPGFFDYALGLMDLSHGGIVGLAEPAVICTRNAAHSYYRPTDTLGFLAHSDQLMELRDILMKRLEETEEDFDADEAMKLTSNVIRRRIASACGVAPHRIEGFTQQPLFAKGLVAEARQSFQNMFTPGTPERTKLDPKFKLISENLQSVLVSDDNATDATIYSAF